MSLTIYRTAYVSVIKRKMDRIKPLYLRLHSSLYPSFRLFVQDLGILFQAKSNLGFLVRSNAPDELLLLLHTPYVFLQEWHRLLHCVVVLALET